MLGLRFCARAFSSFGKWGPLFIVARGPLIIVASLVAEHRLQTRRLSWDLNPSVHGVLGALPHDSLSPPFFCSFQKAASITAAEVMIRGRRNPRQDAEKPVY